jgi:hypothetical protein
MDHLKIASLFFSHKNKAIDSFMKLPIAVTGMMHMAMGICNMPTKGWISTRAIQTTPSALLQSC